MNSKYRNNLPQLNGKSCITDGGLETSLVFHEGFDLPLFAAFPLLDRDDGRAALERYHAPLRPNRGHPQHGLDHGHPDVARQFAMGG